MATSCSVDVALRWATHPLINQAEQTDVSMAAARDGVRLLFLFAIREVVDGHEAGAALERRAEGRLGVDRLGHRGDG